MSIRIEKHLPELVAANIITEEQAQKIKAYFENKTSKSNFLLVIYGVLGALLVGLGIILIIGHNWDDLSRNTKLVIAFIPLVIGQAGCLYSIIKTKNNVLKESFAVFLFFAIASTISLVAQIYHISGDFEKFLLTWCLLSLPIVYLIPSSMVSLLFIALVTLYGCNAGYENYQGKSYWFWLLLLAAIPYSLKLFKITPSNFITWHLWFYCAAITILLGTFGYKLEEYVFMAYVCLFSIYLLISHFDFLKNRKMISQPFYLTGIAGTFILLLASSFDWYWAEIKRMDGYNLSLANHEVALYTVLVSIALLLLLTILRKINYKEFNPAAWSFIVFSICFFIGKQSQPFTILVINAWIFYLGVRYIFKGSGESNLLTVNFGLIIISALILCRYFDTSISFLLRGIGFLAIGTGFFIANYLIIQKRKKLNKSI